MFRLLFLIMLIPCMLMAEISSDEISYDSWHKGVLLNGERCGVSDTVYSTPIMLTNSDHHGLFVRTTSDGAVDMTLTIEYAFTPTSDFVVSKGDTWSWQITSTGDHVCPLTGLTHMSYMRFKVVGAAGNDGTGHIDVVIIKDTKQK